MSHILSACRWVICDSCLQAARDEVPWELDDTEAGIHAMDLGGEIPDHLCEEVEGDLPESDRCVCGCRPPVRSFNDERS